MARHDTSCCTSSQPPSASWRARTSARTLSVGASAALFGLIGAMIAAGMRSNTAMGAAIKAQYTQWVIYMVVIGLLPIFNIDTAAHLGGLAGGFAIAWLMDTPRTSGRGTDTMWRIACGPLRRAHRTQLYADAPLRLRLDIQEPIRERIRSRSKCLRQGTRGSANLHQARPYGRGGFRKPFDER